MNEKAEHAAVGRGMAMAAGIAMKGFGNEMIAKEILSSAGYSSVADMKKDGIDDYYIKICEPLFK